jgi:[glutamine synthetase] adenylyltransferase / [glutamine synthetase]-adenylyl-L-tyrosine phosphorylase
VKLCDGGLVDLEFAIHVAQLVSRSGFDPHLGSALNSLMAAGLAPAGAHKAYQLLTRLLVTLRLVAPDLEPPDAATQALVARACDMPDWAGLLDRLHQVRQEVSQYWQQAAKGSDDG